MVLKTGWKVAMPFVILHLISSTLASSTIDSRRQIRGDRFLIWLTGFPFLTILILIIHWTILMHAQDPVVTAVFVFRVPPVRCSAEGLVDRAFWEKSAALVSC